MIVYGMNRLPLAQDSNQNADPAFAPGLEGASEIALAAIPAPVMAEGSSELVAETDAMRPCDEGDNPPIKK
ncbi:MAG TPA: hypothetical protein VNM90_18285 [Haliangium sp.]|nr:hypothetical protein [Haliangium sp.]